MIDRLKRFWTTLWRPSVHYSLAFLTVGGFIAGVIFWGGFNTAMELTNTEKFCTGCHEMRDNVFAELKPTIHYSTRKMQASKEVWGKIFGTISTPEKFEAKRLEMAQREWIRFKSNDSLECRNCHSEKSMDFTRQSLRASEAHQRFLVSGEKTCIDCHKGIAHELPDMSTSMGHGHPSVATVSN